MRYLIPLDLRKTCTLAQRFAVVMLSERLQALVKCDVYRAGDHDPPGALSFSLRAPAPIGADHLQSSVEPSQAGTDDIK